MKLIDLHKGDIFQEGKNSWNGIYRYHSHKIVGNRVLLYLMGVGFDGDITNCSSTSFTWRDVSHKVYIPVFYKCEFKKTRDIPCIPVSNHRNFFPTNLNPINISDKYCERNDYWYDYADLIF